jgi:hypothetical protein
MTKQLDTGDLGFQPPPGYDIGGDRTPEHHGSAVRPVVTDPAQAAPSKYQPPRGQILGDDLPMKQPEDFAGATENVMGGAKIADIRNDPFGFIPLGDNPSVDSLNPAMVDVAESPPRTGFLRRAGGWER